MDALGLFMVVAGLLGATATVAAAAVAMGAVSDRLTRKVAKRIGLAPVDRNAWHRLGELHRLTAVSDTRYSGELDGLAIEVTEPLAGYLSIRHATVFTLHTGRAGLHIARRISDKQGPATGHDAFDRAAHAVVTAGHHHELHAELREAWIDADAVGVAEVRPDGRVIVALRGVGLDDATLSAGLSHARALAAQRIATPSAVDFVARPEPPSLLIATIDHLATVDADAARDAAQRLRAHPDRLVRVAAAAALGPADLLQELRASPVEVLCRLPIERVPDAFDQLGRREAVPAALRRVVARRLAAEPTEASLPLVRWLLTTDDKRVQAHCVEALGVVGTVDDVPGIRQLPQGPAHRAAVERIQQRAGGEAGAVSLATDGQAGRLAISAEERSQE